MITSAVLFVIACSIVFYFMIRLPAHMRAGYAVVRAVERGHRVELVELENKFGPSDRRSFSEWDAAYRLGDDGTYFAMDSSWLVVRVDPADGRVIDADVLVD